MPCAVLSHVRLLRPPLTTAQQARLSMGFSRQEYWSGSPFPSPGDLPAPGIEPVAPALAGRFFTFWGIFTVMTAVSVPPRQTDIGAESFVNDDKNIGWFLILS